jgi:hypothetical protein
MIILGSPFAFQPGTMKSAIDRLGLTSGLKLCLDASDVNSYSGAGQSWLDTSGNGYDFFRGTTSASQSTDPTFNGSAGGQSSSEYWSFDGGDFFTYDSANETWMQNLHKDGAVFSFAAWVYIATTGTPQVFICTTQYPDRIGFSFYCSSIGTARFAVDNGTGQAYIEGTLSIPIGQWSFVGVSLTEATGAGGAVYQVNGTQETKTSTYTSPSSASASNITAIGYGTDDSAPIDYILNGGRMASLVAWEGTAISAAELLSLYNATKSKFGL